MSWLLPQAWPWRRGERRGRLAVPALAAALSCLAGCSDTPTQPTPAFTVACPAPTIVTATGASGASAPYAPPKISGGVQPATVSCSAPSGQVFPIGTTVVSCSAHDGAGHDSACQFSVTVTPGPRLTRTRYLAFGDSITAGEVTAPAPAAGTVGPLVLVPSAAYPAVLEDRLEHRYLVQDITMVNAGLPGQSAAAAMSRYQDTMNRERPEVLLLLMGSNDLASTSSVATGANALAAMVRDAKGRGVQVFLATLTPTIAGRQRSQPQDLLDAMNARIRLLAGQEGVPLVDIYQGLLPAVTTWIGIDGLHPNEAGYAHMADLFFERVREVLEAP